MRMRSRVEHQAQDLLFSGPRSARPSGWAPGATFRHNVLDALALVPWGPDYLSAAQGTGACGLQ
jgi:hypothetical protein